MYKYFLAISILLAFSSNTFAKKRFFSLSVKAREDGDLIDVLKSSTDLPRAIYKQKGFINMIKKYNPKLKKKDSVKKGEKIYIEMPYNTAMYYAKLARPKPTPEDDRYDYSFSYSFSRKLITDSETDGESIESQQNAPVTIGFSVRKPINENYSFFSTAYLSRMNDAEVFNQEELQNQVVSVPIESAIKIYVQRKFENTRFQVYGGFDIERLTTFKTVGTFGNTSIARLQHSFAFLTIGIQRPFSFFEIPMLFKVSYARSVWNGLDLQAEENTEIETFSGNKVASLFIISLTKRTGIHSFFDWHLLSAETDLDMKRFGVGMHFRF